MRFDKKIGLVKETTGGFNPETGDYDDGTKVVDDYWASVTDMNDERMNFLYGELRKGAYVIRLQGHILRKFDYVQMNGKKYQVDNQRVLRRLTTLQVSEKP